MVKEFPETASMEEQEIMKRLVLPMEVSHDTKTPTDTRANFFSSDIDTADICFKVHFPDKEPVKLYNIEYIKIMFAVVDARDRPIRKLPIVENGYVIDEEDGVFRMMIPSGHIRDEGRILGEVLIKKTGTRKVVAGQFVFNFTQSLHDKPISPELEEFWVRTFDDLRNHILNMGNDMVETFTKQADDVAERQRVVEGDMTALETEQDRIRQRMKEEDVTTHSELDEALHPIKHFQPYTITLRQDFRDKVAGSVIENPHIVRKTNVSPGQNTFLNPGHGEEFHLPYYSAIAELDSRLASITTNVNESFSQHLFSFNIVEALERELSPAVWRGRTSLADKVTIAREIIMRGIVRWRGMGSGPSGTGAFVRPWSGSSPNPSWGSPELTHANLNVTQLQVNLDTQHDFNWRMTTDGFIHVIAFAEASDGVTPSIINTNFIELELQVNLQHTPLGHGYSKGESDLQLLNLEADVREDITANQEEFANASMTSRNILKNSRHASTIFSNDESVNQVTIQTMVEDGVEFRRVRPGQNSRDSHITIWGNIPISNFTEPVAGKIATISVKVRASREVSVAETGGVVIGNPRTVIAAGVVRTFTTRWSTMAMTFRFPDDMDWADIVAFLPHTGHENMEDGFIDYRDWAITLADDLWTPAPEDMMAQLIVLEEKLEKNQGELHGELQQQLIQQRNNRKNFGDYVNQSFAELRQESKINGDYQRGFNDFVLHELTRVEKSPKKIISMLVEENEELKASLNNLIIPDIEPIEKELKATKKALTKANKHNKELESKVELLETNLRSLFETLGEEMKGDGRETI